MECELKKPDKTKICLHIKTSMRCECYRNEIIDQCDKYYEQQTIKLRAKVISTQLSIKAIRDIIVSTPIHHNFSDMVEALYEAQAAEIKVALGD